MWFIKTEDTQSNLVLSTELIIYVNWPSLRV